MSQKNFPTPRPWWSLSDITKKDDRFAVVLFHSSTKIGISPKGLYMPLLTVKIVPPTITLWTVYHDFLCLSIEKLKKQNAEPTGDSITNANNRKRLSISPAFRKRTTGAKIITARGSWAHGVHLLVVVYHDFLWLSIEKLKKHPTGLRTEGSNCPSWFKPYRMLIIVYHVFLCLSIEKLKKKESFFRRMATRRFALKSSSPYLLSSVSISHFFGKVNKNVQS